ncbi:MAG TPA: GNAT family N-acetyltransferase [Sphingomicrobium sp.]|nr:GNAT family N-acetyltransferase [Sphingomicrobium sp.]
MSLPLANPSVERDLLARGIESDCTYFEMGAQLEQLEGATVAWMPGLTRSPAAAVVHRVDPEAIASGGAGWIASAEAAMANVGAALCRIYLDGRHKLADDMLRNAGYAARDELIFVDALPESSINLTLCPVATDADWAEKLSFHKAAGGTPDGHGNGPADWVELERRKCSAGMEAFLARLDGEVVGAVGAIWCDKFVRTKNLVVHPDHRGRGVAQAMLGGITALGRRRGTPEQCVVAVKGEKGELLYRRLQMPMIGYQVEWSKPIAGGAR